jgi:integrase
MPVRKRGQVWYARYMLDGKSHQYTLPGATSKTEAQAMETADRLRLAQERQADPPAEPVPVVAGRPHPDMLLSEAAQRTYREKWRNNKTGEAARRTMALLIEAIGHDPKLSALNNSVLADIRATLEEKLPTATTANRYCAALKTVLRRASTLWEVLKFAPHIEMQSEVGNERDRVLSNKEITALHDCMLNQGRYTAADLCWFLLDTGARLGEALSLPWRECNFKDGRMAFKDTKSGRARHVTMSERCKQMLIRRQEEGEPCPFEITEHQAEYAMVAARKTLAKEGRIDPTGVIWHAFRHTCASRLTSLGIGQHRVVTWMGWRTPSMFMRYAHLDPSAMTEVAEAVNGW